MGLTVAGVDLGDDAHATWSDDPGRQSTITGRFARSGVNAFAVGVQQLLGLLNLTDEDAVPVIPSQDTTRTGFFRITGGSIDMDPAALNRQSVPIRLELASLPDRYSPLIESRVYGTLRSNAHSVAIGTTVPWWATPADATQDYVAGTTATRAGETGTVKVAYNTSGATYYDDRFLWQCLASDWMDGAAIVEVTDGSSWYRLPGNRTATLVALGWRVNNGQMRFSAGSAGSLSVEHYFSGAWTTAKSYKITYGSAGTAIGDWKSFSILRNDPACVTVLLTAELSSTYPAQVNVYLTVRRGAYWIDGLAVKSSRLTATTGTGLGVFCSTVEAAATHTSGIHANIADAAGTKYILTTSLAKTNDLTNGGLYVAYTSQTLPFMIGREPGSASGPDTYTNQVWSWFAPTDETVRFVRR